MVFGANYAVLEALQALTVRVVSSSIRRDTRTKGAWRSQLFGCFSVSSCEDRSHKHRKTNLIRSKPCFRAGDPAASLTLSPQVNAGKSLQARQLDTDC